MTTMASQITSITVVYSIVYSGADQRKHQSSASLAFVRGIHRDRWIPRTKGQWRGKYFHMLRNHVPLSMITIVNAKHSGIILHKNSVQDGYQKYSRKWKNISYFVTPWWRHQMETCSALLALCAGNSPLTGEFPSQRGQWRGALMFPLICAWINGWLNNREAGDLRRHRPIMTSQ